MQRLQILERQITKDGFVIATTALKTSWLVINALWLSCNKKLEYFFYALTWHPTTSKLNTISSPSKVMTYTISLLHISLFLLMKWIHCRLPCPIDILRASPRSAKNHKLSFRTLLPPSLTHCHRQCGGHKQFHIPFASWSAHFVCLRRHLFSSCLRDSDMLTCYIE